MPLKWLDDFRAGARTKLAQWNTAAFRDAAMSACALIAAADGKVEPAERKKVVGLIANEELLRAFDAADLGKLFEASCDKAADDFARIGLIRTVGRLKNTPDQADTVVRVAMLVAGADGNFDESEKKVVRELCASLGLSSDAYLTA